MAGRLRGLTILLTADFLDYVAAEGEEWSEDEVRAREEEMIRVDEAIVSLARAVFSEGGRLAFADHPLMISLIGQIASEYPEPVELEKARPETPVGEPRLALVFQAARQPAWSVESDWLSDIGLVDRTPEFPEKCEAAVYIGGREAQASEWLGLDRGWPRFVISSTGGAARAMGEGSIDEHLWQDNESIRKELPRGERSETDVDETVPELRYAMYPLLMSRIVDAIAKMAH